MSDAKQGNPPRRGARLNTVRVASDQDLERREEQLARQGAAAKSKKKAGRGALLLPLQAPPFLAGIPNESSRYAPRQPATKKLKKIIEDNYYRGNFEKAITRVAGQNVPELSDIKTLDQFYFYVDALVTWVPETRVWECRGDILHERTVYLRIVQFYYYFNQPELEVLQSPISPVDGQRLSPLSEWLRDFAVEWGSFLDTGKSTRYLGSFQYAPEFSWQDYEKAPEEYGSFNEFFGRCFADIDRLRPVAKPDDDRTIVFPAESTFVGRWSISTPVGAPMPAGPSVVVKHIQWPIQELLADSEYAEDFAGGMFCHSFLNTYDYHRLHTPVAGRVLEAKFVPGQAYLQVGLKSTDPEAPPNPDLANAIIPSRYLDADDPTGYQFVQCRGLLVLDNPNLGKVAVLPMGMAQVSSVVFTAPGPKHKPIRLSKKEREGKSYAEQVEMLNRKIADQLVGQELDKGEMFSFFQFGGSDCVVVFERKANVTVTATRGVHYAIRSQYAVANY